MIVSDRTFDIRQNEQYARRVIRVDIGETVELAFDFTRVLGADDSLATHTSTVSSGAGATVANGALDNSGKRTTADITGVSAATLAITVTAVSTVGDTLIGIGYVKVA